jgi:imidazoleglycerol phosphate synthase glutamine amidotransferase subunit HisH
MIMLVDYGVGNIQAFMTLFKRMGLSAQRVQTPQELEGATRLVLPGVGHFDHAMQQLNDSGLRPALKSWCSASMCLWWACVWACRCWRGARMKGCCLA